MVPSFTILLRKYNFVQSAGKGFNKDNNLKKNKKNHDFL
jgi:hypothetical protein